MLMEGRGDRSRDTPRYSIGHILYPKGNPPAFGKFHFTTLPGICGATSTNFTSTPSDAMVRVARIFSTIIERMAKPRDSAAVFLVIVIRKTQRADPFEDVSSRKSRTRGWCVSAGSTSDQCQDRCQDRGTRLRRSDEWPWTNRAATGENPGPDWEPVDRPTRMTRPARRTRR